MASLQQSQALAMAEQEIEAFTDLFNRLSNTCWTKCIASSYSDGQLSKGESVCIDRCVAKYTEVHDKVGKKLAEMQQLQQGQADPAQ